LRRGLKAEGLVSTFKNSRKLQKLPGRITNSKVDFRVLESKRNLNDHDSERAFIEKEKKGFAGGGKIGGAAAKTTPSLMHRICSGLDPELKKKWPSVGRQSDPEESPQKQKSQRCRYHMSTGTN